MSELVGHVDQRERPLVRVSLPDRDRSFLALVDTGFNGWLLMEIMDAVSLGFVPTELTVSVEFAGRGQSRLGVDTVTPDFAPLNPGCVAGHVHQSVPELGEPRRSS